MPLDADTLSLAQKLWARVAKDGDVDDRTDDLALTLREKLDLPPPSPDRDPVTVPAGGSGQVLIFEPADDRYAVKAAHQFESESARDAPELPVVIDTREGLLVLDPDDPLARAFQGVERLRKL